MSVTFVDVSDGISGKVDFSSSVVEVTSISLVVSFRVDTISEVAVELEATSNEPSVLELADDISSFRIDGVSKSKFVLELELLVTIELVISFGNVEVDSDSVLSVVDSGIFAVDGRVTSGGHGLSFVVLLIVGRVVKIDDELSKLEEISVVDAS